MGSHEEEEKEKKPIYKKWWFWVIIIIVILIIASSGSSDTTETSDTENVANTEITAETEVTEETNNNEESTTEDTEVDKTQTIYDSNNIVIQITDWEYHSVLDYIDVSVYIENNSNQNIVITIDGDATLEGYSLDTYFYESVNTGTKSNTSFSVYDLLDNGIDENSLSSLKFRLKIYDSDTYKDIDSDIEVEYLF